MSGRLRDYETRRAMRLALLALENAVRTAERREAALYQEERRGLWLATLEGCRDRVRYLILNPDGIL